MNTQIEYLYRDASNYTHCGKVTFRGPCDTALRDRLSAALDSQELFVAHQIRLPELFFADGRLYADDHCFHELAKISATEDPTDDALNRTIGDFVAETEQASRSGWAAFDRWAGRPTDIRASSKAAGRRIAGAKRPPLPLYEFGLTPKVNTASPVSLRTSEA
jgi:hypothetical protein